MEVSTLKELTEALKKGNATILMKADVDLPKDTPGHGITTTASNITLDGQGHSITGDNLPTSQVREGRGSGQMLTFSGGKNLIVKNLRIRNSNSGGNLRFSQGACDAVVDHVSSNGCCNKGIAVSNGAHDVTITHCFIGGCTRPIFCKYDDARNITVDHCIITKLWMRAPMMEDIKVFDVRNNLVRDWVAIGARMEGATTSGNIMGNIYQLPSEIPEEYKKNVKPDKAILYPTGTQVGKVYIADNEFRNCSTASAKSTVDRPLAAPEIVPPYSTDFAKLEKMLLSETEGAGCMPRDDLDKAYLASKEFLKAQGSPLRIKLEKKTTQEK